MKIVKLTAENIKKLTAVEITPTGNLVQITGKNGNGKSSVLDSIWWALAGASNIQAKPIRQGETQARIRLDLGEIIVTRLFTSSDSGDVTSKITVETAEGAKFSSPQKMLDELIGNLSFDPLGFARMEPKEQLKALRQFVPGVDFDEQEAANKADYELRRECSRKAKDYEAAAANAAKPFDIAVSATCAVPEIVDEAMIMKKIGEASEHNRMVDAKRYYFQQQKKEYKNLEEQIEILRTKMLEINKKLEEEKNVPEPMSIIQIEKEFDTIREKNKMAAVAKQVSDLMRQAVECEKRAKELTAKMEDRVKFASEAVKAASMPVDGITFGEQAVLLNGVPFNQASDAEQLRVSMAIAMAMNPKLRVIRVRDGSLLDEDSMKVVEKMATDKDFQVWIERVDGSGKTGFVLEDGHLKGEANA